MAATSAEWVGVRQAILVTVFLSYLVNNSVFSSILPCNGWRDRQNNKK